MKKWLVLVVCTVLIGGSAASAHFSRHDLFEGRPPLLERLLKRDRSFQRVATFANYRNNQNIADETVSEIVAASGDGRMLVYTDSPMGAIGFIDIGTPGRPQPAGKFAFPSGHEPTSVETLGNRYALVAVNSSTSFTSASGYLAVIDMFSRTLVREIDLGGQPDSIKVSPDRRFAAIAMENERNEFLCVGGALSGVELDEDDGDQCEDGGGVFGGLPQTPFGNPAGYLAVISLAGPGPFNWTRSDVQLTGLADYAPEDPEPEFVDINADNRAVVTLQENNHVAIVDLRTGAIVSHFPAGTVTLSGVDAEEDGVIELTDTIAAVRREPDAVAWVPGHGNRMDIATANEGDLFGGSRGFSIFAQNGSLAFDAGATFDHLAVRHGHYPEDRSENKGTEPEAIEYARFGQTDYLFVASERGSFVAVYQLDRQGRPVVEQLLPAPLGPEGLLAIPERGLLVVSGEDDSPSFGVRSSVMIYQLRTGDASYPQLVSTEAEDSGAPIPWSAMSGLTSIPGRPETLLGVWDSYYSESRIFRIDVSEKPAVVTDALTIQGGRGSYDPEGITIAPDGSIWIASEGNASDSRPNLLIQLDRQGQVLREVGLPAEILACRAATTQRGTLGSGFEGVAAVAVGGGAYRLYVAQQRGWDYTTAECEALDDDGGGLNTLGEPNRTRLWVFDPVANAWSHVAWELTARPTNAAWVGLSEISYTPNHDFVVLERDNRTGDFGVVKTLVRVSHWSMADGVIAQAEKSVHDIRPALVATNGWITDKPEGVAVTDLGKVFVVTDNDGVEDWSGESQFLHLGSIFRLFR